MIHTQACTELQSIRSTAHDRVRKQPQTQNFVFYYFSEKILMNLCFFPYIVRVHISLAVHFLDPRCAIDLYCAHVQIYLQFLIVTDD